MALSNIFQEPRREIIETVVGIVPVGAFFVTVVASAYWFKYYTGWSAQNEPHFIFALIVGVVAAIFSWVIVGFSLIVAHSIGEGICDEFEARGIHLRPKNRPGRK